MTSHIPEQRSSDPRPAASPVHWVTRPELAPLQHALSTLATSPPDHFLYAITAIQGGGKTSALLAQAAVARLAGLAVVERNLAELMQQREGRNGALQDILQAVAEAAHLSTPDDASGTPGLATLEAQARKLCDYLASAEAPALVILLDDADETRDARALTTALEDLLLTPLHDYVWEAHRTLRTLVVFSSRQELPWKKAHQYQTALVLRPFDDGQTCQQLELLGHPPAEAARLTTLFQPAAQGLPGGTHLLASGWPATADLPPLALFEEVYEHYVVRTIGNDPRLADLVRGIALLGPAGFTVADLRQLTESVSYLRGRHMTEGNARYYGYIDRMYALGLVRFDNQINKFRLEPHLIALLSRWNELFAPVDYTAYLGVGAAVTGGDREPVVAGAVSPPSTPVGSERIATEAITLPTNVGKYLTQVNTTFKVLVESSSTPGKPDDKKKQSFVGRQESLLKLGGWVCRQSGEVDVVFVQGSPGSGKTALIEHFLRQFRTTISLNPPDPQQPALLVATRLHSTKELKDQKKNGQPNPDAPYLGPVPGLIDVEFSFGNRMGTVRRTMRDRLVDALLWEEYVFNDKMSPEAIMLGIETDKLEADRNRVMDQYFAEFQTAERAWREFTRTRQTGSVQERRARARQLQTNLEHTFLAGCLKVAGKQADRAMHRRILIVFDTFDYPVRSGLSATQFISQITGHLAGDYIFLIACRPPTPLEVQDPYVQGNLANYLPDDLRDQAQVLNLDNEDLLTAAEAETFYAQEAEEWEVLRDPAMVQNLVDVFMQHGQSPVLLSLLEFYAGIIQDNRRSGFEPNLPALAQTRGDDFAYELIDGLLQIAGPHSANPRGPNLLYQTALLLMGVINRGISRQILTGFPADGDSPPVAGLCARLIPSAKLQPDDPDPAWLNPDGIWTTVEQLALIRMDPETGIPESRSTLIKPVRNVLGQRAYKLHDYVSGMFDTWSRSKLQELRDQGLSPDDPASEPLLNVQLILGQREQVLRAVIGYMYELGQQHVPRRDSTLTQTEQDALEEHLLFYHPLRAALVYYGLGLAAIQYAREQEEGAPAAAETETLSADLRDRQAFIASPDSTPGKLADYLSTDLVQLG